MTAEPSHPESEPAPAGDQPAQDSFRELLPALAHLDRLLTNAVLAAQSAYGPESALDPYRGLYISPEEAVRLLRREPAAPVLHQAAGSQTTLSGLQTAPAARPFAWLGRWFKRQDSEAGPEEPRNAPLPQAPPPPIMDPTPVSLPLVEPLAPESKLAWLARIYDLTPFDLDLLLIALAPELDLRYERLYAYLQDDVTFRRPSVDLALNLLCADASEKAARRVHFSAQAPLVRLHLIHLDNPRDPAPSPLLDHAYRIDGQFVRLLINERTLDPRLADFSSLIAPEERPPGSEDGLFSNLLLNQASARSLGNLTAQAWNNGRSLRLYFHGPAGIGKFQAARWAAGRLSAPLLHVDLAGLLSRDPELRWAPQVVFREAWFQNAILYLSAFDRLSAEVPAPALHRLWETLVRDEGITILAGEQPWKPVAEIPGGVVTVAFPGLDYDQRRSIWQSQLENAGVFLPDEDLDGLAARFNLTPAQIAEASATALGQARWRSAGRPEGRDAPVRVALADLFAAARAQTGHHLADLAIKIDPLYRWGDIVLPEDTLLQLREISQRVAYRHTVLEEMGFERKLSRGKGITVLFAGPSGTGKTMAAEVLANDLGLELFRIDLSGVVSKYIGETEKNLEKIFQAAEKTNAILFFDEADSLFGKRSEVRDAHDRYANIEISYLLQKMEAYDGIAILATNLRQNLDEAFTRRLAFTVSFPFPDVNSRRLIWEGIWPDGLDRGFTPEDLDSLAERFRLAGGNIKNIALAAAFLAASEQRPVAMEHLLSAVRREYQKMGKNLSDEELFGAARERVPA